MPSSSARCAQLPRALDKVPYYIGLRKLRDYLRGDIAELDDSEIIFPSTPLEQKLKTEVVKEESLDLDEDDTSTSSTKDLSLTLEQIQQQAEYQEALMASAEGIDLSQEAWAHQGFGSRNPGKNVDYQFSQSFMSFDSIKDQAIATSATPIKQEYSFNDHYDSVGVRGPTAEKVNIDQNSPYQCHTSSSSPQYTSLGELPAKQKIMNKTQRISSSQQHPVSRVAQSAPPSPYSPIASHNMHQGHQPPSGVMNSTHPAVSPGQPIPGYHQPVHQGHNSGFNNIKLSPSYR